MHFLRLSFLLLLAYTTQAQNQLSDVSKERINMGGVPNNSTSVLWGQTGESRTVVGEIYLDTLWHTGSVKLNQGLLADKKTASDSIGGIQMRYNIYENEIEVLANEARRDIRVIPGNQLKYFTLNQGTQPMRFINTRQFQTNEAVTGFYELLAPGRLQLAKHHRTKTIKPNYNTAFGTGEKNARIELTSDYYVISQGKAARFSPSKKTVLALMQDQQAAIEAYMKTNKISFRDPSDLAKLFAYYNQL
ncbi:hypothetical protein [Siphonobacter sp.]|uniref:hypothetical protein n=1 Tax=Siphonobacter sp. TaxID=1869184 RepID=UPI003B3AE174